jgi:hypothetical protein
MTPKEKAIELYNKFYNTSNHPHHVETRQQIAKQCALIAVDEIISEYGTYYKVNIDDKYVSYWQEVKQEIEKL